MGEIAGLIEEYELNKGEPLWVPEGTVEPTAVLPKNWAQYFAMRHAPTDDKAVRGLMTDSLCFPLTAIHALELALLGTTNTAGATTGDNMGGSSSSGGKALAGALKRDKLVIHLLGAEEAECNGLDKWGELLQMFPGVKACTLVMVGPEIDEELDGVMQVGSVGVCLCAYAFIGACDVHPGATYKSLCVCRAYAYVVVCSPSCVGSGQGDHYGTPQPSAAAPLSVPQAKRRRRRRRRRARAGKARQSIRSSSRWASASTAWSSSAWHTTSSARL